MISLPAILQLAALASFTVGACLYYGLRRLLHRHGYPVSAFVYSGSCWPHLQDLLEKSDPPARRRLKARRTAIIATLTLAGALLVLASALTFVGGGAS